MLTTYLQNLPWLAAALCGTICLLTALIYLLRWRMYGLPARWLKKPADPKQPETRQGLSVVVTAHDQARQLEESLPRILQQRDAVFEVIVVNDASTDDTEDVLKRFASQYKNLYHTFVPASMRYIDRRKLAATLGIRAARYEWVVLTRADCAPADERWLSLMEERCGDDVDFVLGYANYENDNSATARRAIYERLKNALRYFAAAIGGKAIGGDGCNLALRKSYFLAQKGFADSLRLTCGEDCLLVDALAAKRRTAVELRPEATVLQKLPHKRLYHTEKLAYAETLRHLGRRGQLYRLREGAASALNTLLLLASVAFIALRSYEIATSGTYQPLSLRFDLPALLAMGLSIALPCLSIRQTTKKMEERGFGMWPCLYDFFQPLRNWLLKVESYRCRREFIRK